MFRLDRLFDGSRSRASARACICALVRALVRSVGEDRLCVVVETSRALTYAPLPFTYAKCDAMSWMRCRAHDALHGRGLARPW